MNVTTYYDEVARDPGAFFAAVHEATGAKLDELAYKLGLVRDGLEVIKPLETDDALRARVISKACSCRGPVHVLGIDETTWHHCQCGAKVINLMPRAP